MFELELDEETLEIIANEEFELGDVERLMDECGISADEARQVLRVNNLERQAREQKKLFLCVR